MGQKFRERVSKRYRLERTIHSQPSAGGAGRKHPAPYGKKKIGSVVTLLFCLAAMITSS